MEDKDERTIKLKDEQVIRVLTALKHDCEHHKKILKKLLKSHKEAEYLEMKDSFNDIVGGYRERILQLMTLATQIETGALDI